MSQLDWSKFENLSGAADVNFEKLCRSLIRRHYGQYGSFKELANQAGVEFHLKLDQDCTLGDSTRWYGWQCKWYDLPRARAIGATRKAKIVDGLDKSKKYLPNLTDWVLWTKYILTESDQKWFYGLQANYPFKLHLQTCDDIENLLVGPALALREAYFGELVIDEQVLNQNYQIIASTHIKKFQPEVHQTVKVEEIIGKCLGRHSSWESIDSLGKAINNNLKIVKDALNIIDPYIQTTLPNFLADGEKLGSFLNSLFLELAAGNFEKVKDLLSEDIDCDWSNYRKTVSRLRAKRSHTAMTAANLLADFYSFSREVKTVRKALNARVIAVVGKAGDGKTDLALDICRPKESFNAGVLFLGKDLKAGGNLDDLVKVFKIYGKSVSTFENLLEAIDAAGQRLGIRIPIVIDGLSESEDPRNWRDEVAKATTLLENYPNVLLILTLRSEFYQDCIPENTPTSELNGFADNPSQVIHNYFEYYKIDALDADIPIELLSHPLTLRLYCEAANAERRVAVGVEALPRSQVAIFEQYFKNAIDRIVALSSSNQRLYHEDIEDALLNIAKVLWKENRRTLNFKRARKIANDIVDWGSSLIRSLESEGILLRYGTQNGKQKIGFSYDLMAGFKIAEYLLKGDFNNWIRKNINKIQHGKPHSNTLAYDVFNSLVGLYPKYYARKHFWQLLEGDFKERALLQTTQEQASLINRDTIQEFQNYLLSSEKFASQAFKKLKTTRSAYAHPFDANFLDKSLRNMSNTYRDLTWSEWIRKNSRELKIDLEVLEKRWSEIQIGSNEKGRAIWVQWLLTTTHRDLRDQATKVLSIYAKKDPRAFFEMAINSLNITDPYVPERTFAAAYGAILSADFIDAEKINSSVCDFAQKIIENCFTPNAQHSTTHTILREYFLGIINYALKVNQHFVSQEYLDHCQKPYTHLPNLFDSLPDVSEERISEVKKAALRMDFNNYTIGRLITNRANYDDSHPDYIETRKTILKRMIQLGYDPEKFKDIDRDISSGSYYNRDENIDRYGKKYSWIAFYEMYGWKSDRGLLADWRDNERCSDVSIDPTFPKIDNSWNPELTDIFTNSPNDIGEWILHGPIPNYFNLLETQQFTQNDSWILLDGFLQEDSKTDYREIFTFMRGFFVANEYVSTISKFVSNKDYLGNNALPEIPENHYKYAGEMVFGNPFFNLHQDTSSRVRFDERDESSFLIEVPVQSYSWESYHSSLNQAGGIDFPNPELCQKLDLKYQNNVPDLYDTHGVASIFRTLKSDDDSLKGHLSYLRKDLFQKYLLETGQTFIWILWGERGQNYKGDVEVYKYVKNNQHLHKQIYIWQENQIVKMD
ncbi:NACHT domain-containing protein [Acinetobacter pittii]|uniref:NACHT domain-containing protein n=1 Tax=Acinetobacter pittii TaxID=48296 RepID=UPI00355BBC95